MNELRAFPTMLRIGFQELVAYRGEVLIWILSTTMPLIMYAVWSTIAQAGPVGRFDEATFAAYFLSTLVVRQLTSCWIVWELNYAIRTGSFSTLLLRPVSPIAYYAAENLGALPFRFLVLLPVVGGAWLLLPNLPFQLTPGRIALYFFTTFLAWLLIFLFQAIFGLLALYTEQSLSFQEAWFGLWAMLSGYLVPLELMPQVAVFARWLPFRAMGSLPTEILLGHLSGTDLALSIFAQLGWVVLTLILMRLVWARALLRYEAFGG